MKHMISTIFNFLTGRDTENRRYFMLGQIYK